VHGDAAAGGGEQCIEQAYCLMHTRTVLSAALFWLVFLQEVKRLGRAVMLSSVAVFGGSGVANQISELKRGTEVRT
jgi:preprotein translocase subunit SecG